MKRSAIFLVGGVIAAALGGPAFAPVVDLAPKALAPKALAQGSARTGGLVEVNPQSLATGYRVSKIVGSTVINEANQSVGTINDLIITPAENVPFAVLSVGGFLGVGTKYVVVPYRSLQIRGDKMLLAGATRNALESLPAFKYGA
jgi:sporulation protein YlmC with PRC-barrel domain